MTDLRTAISAQLRSALAERTLTRAAAASLLGVSRQSMHAYLKGTAVPRPAVLAKAVRLWNLEITVGNNTFGAQAFPDHNASVRLPEQLSFQTAFEALRTEDLRFDIKKKGTEIQISVSLAAA